MVINTETRTDWYPASKDAEHSALNVARLRNRHRRAGIKILRGRALDACRKIACEVCHRLGLHAEGLHRIKPAKIPARMGGGVPPPLRRYWQLIPAVGGCPCSSGILALRGY